MEEVVVEEEVREVERGYDEGTVKGRLFALIERKWSEVETYR